MSSDFPTQPAVPRLREEYPPDIGFGSYKVKRKAQHYPIGDFVGPRVVLWTDEDAYLPGTPLANRSRPGTITALLVLPSAFSTRVGVVPLSSAERAILDKDNKKFSKKSKRDALQHVFFGKDDGGHVELVVDEPLSPAKYAAIRGRLAKDDLTEVHGRWYTKPETPFTEVERYPPMPRNAGFNVFGPMPELAFHGAEGSLLIGDRSRSLDAPAEVRLTDIGAIAELEHQSSIPLPLATEHDTADLRFTTVGRVLINGREQTTFLRSHDSTIEASLAIATILGGFTGLITLALALVRTRGRTHEELS